MWAYVFNSTASGWRRVAKLTPTNGYSCGLFGSTAVINFFGQDRAEVFDKTTSGWHMAAELRHAGAFGFGFSVAVSGSTVVVGGPGAGRHGAAYVFQA